MNKKALIFILLMISVIGYFSYKALSTDEVMGLYYGEAMSDRYIISSTASGILDKVNIKEGNAVTLDMMVASIEHKDLDYQFELAKKELDLANQQLEKGIAPVRDETLAVLENTVKSNKVNESITQDAKKTLELKIKSLQISINQAQINLTQAQTDYDNEQALFEEGFTTSYLVEQRRIALTKAQSALDQLEVELAQLYVQIESQKEALKLSTISTESAQQNLLLTQNGIDSLDQGILQTTIEVSELKIARIEEQVNNFIIKSKVSGVAGTLNYEVGEYITMGAPLATIIDNTMMTVTIYINESELSTIQTGDEVTLVSAVEYENTSEVSKVITYSGTILKIANEAMYTPINIVTVKDRERLVYKVEIQMLPDKAIKSGTLMAVRLYDAVGSGNDE